MLSMSRFYYSAGWYICKWIRIGCGLHIDFAIWLVVYGINVVRGGYVVLWYVCVAEGGCYDLVVLYSERGARRSRVTW